MSPNTPTLTNNSEFAIVRILALSFLLSVLAACQTQEVVSNSPELSSDNIPAPEAAPSQNKTRPTKGVSNPSSDTVAQLSDDEFSNLWDRIRSGFQLQAEYSHPSVEKLIRAHSNNQPLFDLVAMRASPFLFDIVEEIEKRGLPMELALLPIVESTYNPNAYSPDHAVGLWQMLGPTAKSFGVQQDWWFDGRRDPLISTNAALDYLETLHTNFGNDWLVAIGAYNTGGGNMRRAMRRADQAYEDLDFWSLPVALETRSLVPKLLAFAAIVEDIENHPLELPVIENKPALETVQLPSQIDLTQAAQLLAIDHDQLRSFNPGYLQWATHPDEPKILRVPIAKAEPFRQALLELDSSSLITWDRYEIRSGDTLSAIARKLGTRTDVLMHINEMTSTRIVIGQSLLIPRNVASLSSVAGYQLPSQNSKAITVPTRYTVTRGDNLWSIARRFDLKSAEIAAWNGFATDSILRPGQVIDLSFIQNTPGSDSEETELATAETMLHRVSRGDSIEKIAKQHRRSVAELLRWNNLTKSALIFPGQDIRITPPESGVN